MFGDNLRALCADHPSVAAVCRGLGINRTQFNRYLSGESFPRPDVLERICSFFGVDARILLEPLAGIRPELRDFVCHPALEGFFGKKAIHVPTDLFPSGFYKSVRQSFFSETRFVIGVMLVCRQDGYTLLRGFEPRRELRRQGLSTSGADREYRGLVMRSQGGIMALLAHRDATACSFNFLSPETTFRPNLWEGYTARTMREKMTGRRAARMVYEYLGTSCRAVLPAARGVGVVTADTIPRFYRHLLRLDEAFR